MMKLLVCTFICFSLTAKAANEKAGDAHNVAQETASVMSETIAPAPESAAPESATSVTAPAVAAVEAAPDVSVTKLPEDQIPLNIGTTKKATEGGSSAAKATTTMVILAIMLGAGYFGVRRYKISNTINKSNTRIKVISQHYLGPKKSLAIVHVAGESILIGVTDQNISMIKSLSLIDDEVPETLPNHFGQALKSANGMTHTEEALPAAQNGAGATAVKPMANAYELDEEFSFSNVTETVSKKIKSMRNMT